jgi:hypothetical protein
VRCIARGAYFRVASGVRRRQGRRRGVISP